MNPPFLYPDQYLNQQQHQFSQYETAEMKEARRRAEELDHVQPNPGDSPCDALSKWMIRNPETVENFGMMTAMLMGMKDLQIAPLFAEKALLEHKAEDTVITETEAPSPTMIIQQGDTWSILDINRFGRKPIICGFVTTPNAGTRLLSQWLREQGEVRNIRRQNRGNDRWNRHGEGHAQTHNP